MLKQIFLSLIALLLFVGCAHHKEINLSHKIEKEEGIYSLRKAQSLEMDELIKELAPYSIIFVGDHHNTKKTHQFFEKLLKQMNKEGYNLYLANEWFTPDHDELLELYTNNTLDGIRLKERRQWDKFTRYDWELVEPLYEVIKQNGGRLYGMNLSKEQRKMISLKQIDKMDEDLKTFYDGLDVNITAHKDLVGAFLKHCHQMPQKSSENCEDRMYRVQVAWDSYMALNVNKIAKQHLKTPNDKLFVFAGAMHIEQNLGIPLRFARLNNQPFFTLSNQRIADNEEKELTIKHNKADILYLYRK